MAHTITKRGFQVIMPMYWQNMIVESKADAYRLAKQLHTPKSELKFRPYSWQLARRH